jgi:hypothetical protein
MNATTIPRLSFETLTLTDARSQLAKDAQTKLGYSKLAQAIALPDALLYKLRELEIQPLVTEKVKAYKLSKQREGMYSGTKFAILATACLIFFITAFFTALLENGGPDGKEVWSQWHYGINILFGVCGIASIVCTIAGWAHQGQGNRTVRAWYDAKLNDYRGNVPEFVLAKAVTLKTALPGVQFSVEFLAEEKQTFVRPLPDPFLRATLKDESYYIEVWDEKEYETRM